jgi:hypothetical protein
MTSNETLALLARENSVCEEELPSAQTVAARALKERILRTELAHTRPGRPAAGRRMRKPRRWFVLAATVAAVVAAAIARLPRALPEEHIGASPAAAAILERAAVAVTAYTGVSEGRYAYTKARTIYAAIRTDEPPYTYLTPSVRETWVAADGSGRVRETQGKPFFLGPRDRVRWQAAGSPPLPVAETTDERVPAHDEPVPADVLAADPDDLDLKQLDQMISAVPQLPTEPHRLERIIRAYSEKKDPPIEAQMFNQISGLLHSPYASAELRVAAYRVLADVEGVDIGGQMRDAAGRLGTAITAPAGYGGRDAPLNTQEHRQLLIDPTTGNVLAEETVLVKPVSWIDGKPGDVTNAILILEQGWVDSLDEHPQNR